MDCSPHISELFETILVVGNAAGAQDVKCATRAGTSAISPYFTRAYIFSKISDMKL